MAQQQIRQIIKQLRSESQGLLIRESERILKPTIRAIVKKRLRSIFPIYEDAYYELERQHECITGDTMYAEYDTFRRVYKRSLKKEKRSPK